MTSTIPSLSVQQPYGVQELTRFYRIRPEGLEKVRSVSAQTMVHVEQMLDHFYIWMGGLPDFMAFFQGPESLHHVRSMQSLYWKRLLQAEISDDYLRDRRRVGEIHASIGLPVVFYMAGVSMVYDRIAAMNLELFSAGGESDVMLETMTALLHMDAGLICQSFVDKRDRMLQEQSQAVMAMSTPVTEIWDGILLLPIVGLVDSKRSEDIMNAVLNSIRTAKAKEFILDISGVGVVDTAVANYLISISKATSLMGCHTTISGISPAISKTIVQLGVNVNDVNTTATMMDALSNAFEARGLVIEKSERFRGR